MSRARSKIGGGVAEAFAQQDDLEGHVFGDQAFQCGEEGFRAFVVFPAMVPEDAQGGAFGQGRGDFG